LSVIFFNHVNTVGTSIKAISNIKSNRIALSMTVIQALLSTTTEGIGTAVAGIFKTVLLAAASELVKSGATVLSGDASAIDKAEDIKKNFNNVYSDKILNGLKEKKFDNRSKVFDKLTDAKQAFIRELMDAALAN